MRLLCHLLHHFASDSENQANMREEPAAAMCVEIDNGQVDFRSHFSRTAKELPCPHPRLFSSPASAAASALHSLKLLSRQAIAWSARSVPSKPGARSKRNFRTGRNRRLHACSMSSILPRRNRSPVKWSATSDRSTYWSTML